MCLVLDEGRRGNILEKLCLILLFRKIIEGGKVYLKFFFFNF